MGAVDPNPHSQSVHVLDQSHLHLVSPSHTGMTLSRAAQHDHLRCQPTVGCTLVCMDAQASSLTTMSSTALVSHCNTSGRDPQVTWSHDKVTAELPIGSEMFGFWVGPIF